MARQHSKDQNIDGLNKGGLGGQRRDAQAVRWLCGHIGADAGRQWQKVPFLELSEEILADDTVYHDNAPLPGEAELPLPWPRVVVAAGEFCFWMSTSPPAFCPAPQKEVVLNAGLHLVIPTLNDTAFVSVRRDAAGHVSTAFNLFDIEHAEDMMRIINNCGRISRSAVMTINSSSRHLTAIRSARTSCHTKTAHCKPWLRSDLTRIILLDPATAERFHSMPSHQIDSRRQPVPHGRRGHWRYLDDTRRTWIKPAWVGPAEWETHGQIYRVLSQGPGDPVVTQQTVERHGRKPIF